MFRGSIIEASERRVVLACHPAASPVSIAVLPDGELEVRAETASIGPAYHADVIARVGGLLDELDFAWDGDEGDVPQRMLAWLVDELRGGATRIGMRGDRTFLVDAPVQTAIGPRDAAWRERVIADPAHGQDAFAWWDAGPGRAARARALLAMWHEVPWREPLDHDERVLMEQVDEDLRAAHRADRELALPWADWAALIEQAGIDGEHVARVRTRAGDAAATIGYRRHLMEIELAGGWTIALPGSFVGHWEEEDARWWATDGDRAVELTSLTVGPVAGGGTAGDNDESDSAKLLAVAPEAHPVIERIADGQRHGRAEAYDDDGVPIVTGLMAHAPHVAILTCKGGGADRAWALAAWRSLRQL